MTLQEYIEAIKLELTGGILELEVSDEILGKIVNKAFKEVQRYIDTTNFITIPYADCIDLDGFQDYKCSSIVNVYRTEGYDGGVSSEAGILDPMYMQRWMVFSNGGTMYNLQNYLLNYMSYNTLLQMRNTTSTDLFYKEDKLNKKLYINSAYDKPEKITIEYVPIFNDVSEITSEYWQDILQRLALAMTKITLGRVRSRYTQSNALWTQDGEILLEEGNTEISNLREILRANQNLFLPVD